MLEKEDVHERRRDYMSKFVLSNQSDFELAHIFECGQCFRWKKCEDGSYTGVIKNGVVNIKKSGNDFIVESNCDDIDFIKEYLDLNNDYSSVKEILKVDDENMSTAIEYGSGIRILNQDSWEMLISFIISAANNIPRISKTIQNISLSYGKKIEFQGSEYYLFPTPEELSRATMEELRALNLGFRDKYVYGATKLVASGEIDLNEISKKAYKDAKRELMKIPGVGAKIADCILLFSMKKREAFPVDTWIKKVMAELYVDSKDVKKIAEYAVAKFGENAGIAQQYLFYWKRENS